MACFKEKTVSTLKNCKQNFSEQEWEQARQSARDLWNQIIRDNNLRYNDLMDNKNKLVQLELLGNKPMIITGKVTRVVNNRETSSVQLSPAWIEGVEKKNHIVHLDVIEKITPLAAKDSPIWSLDQLMEEMDIDSKNEMLPSVSFPLKIEQDENPFSSRAVKRPRPSFPSLSVRKGDEKHFSMTEMTEALEEQDPCESPDHKKHMAESLGCKELNCPAEAKAKHDILYKL